MRCVQTALLVASVGICLTVFGEAELAEEDHPEGFKLTPGAVVGGVGGLSTVQEPSVTANNRAGGEALGACQHLDRSVGEICANQGASSAVCKAVKRARQSGCSAASGKQELSVGEEGPKSGPPPPSAKEKLKDLYNEARELAVKHVKEKEQV